MQQALRAQASRAPQEGSAFVFWTQQGGWAGNHISVLRLMERPNEDSARATLIGLIALDNLSARTILVRGTDEPVWVSRRCLSDFGVRIFGSVYNMKG